MVVNLIISEGPRVVPLTCHGHSRPVTHLSFSQMVDEDSYFLISACKGQYLDIRQLKVLSANIVTRWQSNVARRDHGRLVCTLCFNALSRMLIA